MRARAHGGALLVGLVLEERGVLRTHQAVSTAAADGSVGGPLGEVTSGTFSPTLNRAIALARLEPPPGGRMPQPGARVLVDIRGNKQAARVAKPPFVRNGKPLIEIQ